jgi:nitric oxide reductase subunit B
MIFRRLAPERAWRERALAYSFWSMNIGLVLMVGLSILPIGIAQAGACVDTGLWFSRSAEFLQSPTIVHLRWLRIVGDTVFLSGVAALVYFVLGLKTGWSYELGQKREAGRGHEAEAPEFG